jgi:hypothetical protein
MSTTLSWKIHELHMQFQEAGEMVEFLAVDLKGKGKKGAYVTRVGKSGGESPFSPCRMRIVKNNEARARTTEA